MNCGVTSAVVQVTSLRVCGRFVCWKVFYDFVEVVIEFETKESHFSLHIIDPQIRALVNSNLSIGSTLK